MDLYKVRNILSMGVPLTQIKLRVTNYSRVSTDHEEQKSSLKNQEDFFQELIINNKNWTYVKGYVDDGKSGTTDYKRNNFMKMITDAKKGKFDLIITKEISRFSRNTLDSIKYTRELLSYGVAVLFLNDNINTAQPDSELRLTIMASMAQDEVRRLSERVKFGMQRSIKNGTILGNNHLFGYKKNKTNNNLIIDKDESIIVKRIYKEYAIDKKSLSKIAKKLNNENIKTSFNSNWTNSSISRLIKNIKYKGYYCGKKTEVVDFMTKKIKYNSKDEWVIYKAKKQIPPIVSEELWNLANARLEKNKRFSKNQKHYSNYLFTKKIYCKKDTTTFNRKISKNKEVSWVCSKYLAEGKKNCDSPIIREKELLKIFDYLIKILSISKENIIDYLSNLYNQKVESKLINQKKFNQKVIELILNKIIVEKINDSKNDILLIIYLKVPSPNIEKSFSFKRNSTYINYHVKIRLQ